MPTKAGDRATGIPAGEQGSYGGAPHQSSSAGSARGIGARGFDDEEIEQGTDGPRDEQIHENRAAVGGWIHQDRLQHSGLAVMAAHRRRDWGTEVMEQPPWRSQISRTAQPDRTTGPHNDDGESRAAWQTTSTRCAGERILSMIQPGRRPRVFR
jgi:hypothetical protein